MKWTRIVGKVVPWALASATALLKAFGVDITWWPTVCAVVLGGVQLLISLIPDKGDA